MLNLSICAALCGEDATCMFLLSLCFPSALGGIQPLRDILHGVAVERLVQSAPNVAYVRRRNDVRQLSKRMVFRQRLLIEHINGRARYLAALEHVDERSFVDDRAADLVRGFFFKVTATTEKNIAKWLD